MNLAGNICCQGSCGSIFLIVIIGCFTLITIFAIICLTVLIHAIWKEHKHLLSHALRAQDAEEMKKDRKSKKKCDPSNESKK